MERAPSPRARASRESGGVALVATLALVLVAAAAAWFGRSEGARTCERCGAVEAGSRVLGLWLATERPATPGRRLLERVAGPCADHRFVSTGCWQGGGLWTATVSCTKLPTGEPAYELCALAGGEDADRLVAYLAKLSPRGRAELTAKSREPVGSETPEGASAWVAAMLAEHGWEEAGCR